MSAPKAVLLLSGGLDSTLAARMMLDQGIEIFALHFTSPFCTCGRGRGEGGAGCSSAALAAARMGIHLKTVAKGADYVEIVRRPPHGHGSGMNPCIDCRIYTFRRARAYLAELGGSFLVSGEVVGQRPMSQRRDTLRLIERESGCADLVLRPLSARNLPPTLPEREGWVDRERLLAIAGRGRSEQMRLAEAWRIGDYPCPAGGCLLTDRGFCGRLRDLFEHESAPDMVELNLLKVGRHLRLPDGRKAVVARNEEENRRLENLARGRYRLFRAESFPGPSIALGGEERPGDEALLAGLYARWAGNGPAAARAVTELCASGSREIILPAAAAPPDPSPWLLG